MLRRLPANVTTTPKVRGEIQASSEPASVLARRYNVSQTTIRRWRKRTGADDRSHVRHNLGQAASPVEEAVIAELRTRAGPGEAPSPTCPPISTVGEIVTRLPSPGQACPTPARAVARR